MHSRILALVLMMLLVGAAYAQDPTDSADHPPGNLNELTLAGLRPGRSRMAAALQRYGKDWYHPSPDEHDIYEWCDARTRLQLHLEANPSQVIQVVTVERMWSLPRDAARCSARLPSSFAATGRGVRLGDGEEKLKHTYGKPFFEGASSWAGHPVQFIVFNFSWAGADRPQILESSFDRLGKLVKMTLSAQYY